MLLQQRTILERAGLAFVGVADHVAGPARRLSARRPFHRGLESGAATTARRGAFQLFQHPLRPDFEHARGGAARGVRLGQQRIAAADVGRDLEQHARPVAQRLLVANEAGDEIEPVVIEERQRPPVDQRRRPLVAEPDVRGAADVDEAVLGHLPGRQPHALAHVGHELVLALHVIDDVVREQDLVRAARFRMQQVVERRGGFDAHARQSECAGDRVDRIGSEVAGFGLHLAQDLQQLRGVAAVAQHAGRGDIMVRHRFEEQRRRGLFAHSYHHPSCGKCPVDGGQRGTNPRAPRGQCVARMPGVPSSVR